MPDALLTSDHFPYVPLTVAIGTKTYKFEALLDTGFSGHVVLPPGAFEPEGPPDLYAILEVADARRISAPVYSGEITVGETPPFDALITILGDEPILGRQVIGRFRVVLDHGARVILER